MPITRIVKMTFKLEHSNDFETYYLTIKDKVAGQPGCNGVTLLKEKGETGVFFTYSQWDSEEDLNNYRGTEAINDLKAKGYKIVATTPHTKDCMIDELPLDQPIALMFGTELDGLTDVALENADAFVKLPMYGFTESYNISVCVALALQSVSERMRKDETIDWHLSEEEKNEILLAWTKNVVKHPGKVEAIYNERFEEE